MVATTAEPDEQADANRASRARGRDGLAQGNHSRSGGHIVRMNSANPAAGLVGSGTKSAASLVCSTARGSIRCRRTSWEAIRRHRRKLGLPAQRHHLGDSHPQGLDPKAGNVDERRRSRRQGAEPVGPLHHDIVNRAWVVAAASRRYASSRASWSAT